MSFFPSPEPLSESPEAGRYERSLQRAADRCSPDASTSWSLDDAAAFWLPGWAPPTDELAKIATLPADGVMGLATWAFVSITGELPLVGRLFKSLTALKNRDWPPIGPYRGVSAHSLCCAAHIAFAPAGKAIGEQLHGTGFRALADKRLSSCHMTDCRDSESLLGHCLPRAAFDAASRAGLLRPTRDIDAGPLALLVTRLDCWRHSLPYMSVRDRGQHLKFLSCPYWVHDAITNLATVVPRLLLDPELQMLVRSHVATSADVWVDTMKTAHAREQWHKNVHRPISGPVRSVDDVVRSTVKKIWRLKWEAS